MNLISKEKFLSLKKSDTIVIYGCGYSINDLTEKDKNSLSVFNSIGFNWFCKSDIHTTFYLLREQGTRKSFSLRGENNETLVSKMSSKSYESTCLVIDDLTHSASRWSRINTHSLPSSQSRFKNIGVILKEKFAKDAFRKEHSMSGDRSDKCNFLINKMMEYDIFNDGLIYDFCTMVPVLHICTFLKYKRIIFVGVDLYDHRYFWLPKNSLRLITKIMGRKIDDAHYVSKYTCTLSSIYTKITGIEMFTLNPKSLLSSYIPIYKI